MRFMSRFLKARNYAIIPSRLLIRCYFNTAPRNPVHKPVRQFISLRNAIKGFGKN
jgi:hypothetical protein